MSIKHQQCQMKGAIKILSLASLLTSLSVDELFCCTRKQKHTKFAQNAVIIIIIDDVILSSISSTSCLEVELFIHVMDCRYSLKKSRIQTFKKLIKSSAILFLCNLCECFLDNKLNTSRVAIVRSDVNCG